MFVLDSLFAFEWLSIQGAVGKAQYRMARGTFHTFDRIGGRCELSFVAKEDNTYWYQSHDQRLGIVPTVEDHHVVLTFVNQTNFNRLWITLPSDPSEHFYGCGEQFTAFDLKGKTATIWVSEHHSVGKLLRKFLRESLFGVNPHYQGKFRSQQTYYAQPTFLSSRKYLIHVESNGYQRYSFHTTKTILSFRDIPTAIHLLHAPDFLSLATLTSQLLGKQPKLPSWTETGLIIASQGGTQSLWNNIELAKAYKIPLAGVWSQDWSGNVITAFGYQVYWNWQQSETLYPNLRDEIAKMEEQNIRFLGYINTFLKEDTPLYQEAKDKGYFVQTKTGEIYHIQSTTFRAGIIDLTHPEAWRWYKNVIKTHMVDLGMKGWMADFGEYLPTDAVLYKGNPELVHNLWPSLWAQLNREVIQESPQADELFFFTRAGYTQTIRHSNTMWSGDQHVDFSKEYGLPSAIVSTLSMATVGIGVNHSDIGGYTTILHMKRSKELLIRWLAMNVFSPMLRCHEGNQPSKNAQFSHDPETLNAFRTLTELFVSLSFYLHELKNQYNQFGHPIVRPLFYHYDEDWTYTESYQFLYGPDILVSPVLLPGATTKKVRLPNDDWIDLTSKKAYAGGIHVVDAPLGRVVAFYRKSSPFRVLFDAIDISSL